MNTPNNTYWATRDGRKMLVAEMEIGHVINCVKMMQLKYGVRQKKDEDPRNLLCRLMNEAKLQQTLIALTDPNL
jgi:hypothetical protein